MSWSDLPEVGPAHGFRGRMGLVNQDKGPGVQSSVYFEPQAWVMGSAATSFSGTLSLGPREDRILPRFSCRRACADTLATYWMADDDEAGNMKVSLSV